MSDWIKNILIEELPEQYREIAEIIGIENTIKLAEHFEKQAVYFKSLDPLINRKKEKYIHENFDGNNHKMLARITGFSERWIYEILTKKRNEAKQSSFFEALQ